MSKATIEEINADDVEQQEPAQSSNDRMQCVRASLTTALQIVSALAERGIFALSDYRAISDMHERLLVIASRSDTSLYIELQDVRTLVQCILIGCAKGKAFQPVELMSVGRFYLECTAWLQSIAPDKV